VGLCIDFLNQIDKLKDSEPCCMYCKKLSYELSPRRRRCCLYLFGWLLSLLSKLLSDAESVTYHI
jgi:hypothetical protein